MCISFKDSILSYISGMVGSIFLIIGSLKNNYKNGIIFGFFSFIVIQVQLAEAIIWKDINCSKKLTKLASKFIYFSTTLHSLILFLIICVVVGFKNIPKNLTYFSLILLMFYITIVNKKFKRLNDVCIKKGKKYLSYSWFNLNNLNKKMIFSTSMIFYWIFIFISLFLIPDKTIVGMSYAILALLITLPYSFIKAENYFETQSLWCHTQGIVSIITYLIYKFYKFKK